MLRLVDPNRTQTVTILETEFQMRSISVREKFAILTDGRSLKADVDSFDHLVENICRAVHSIAGDEDVAGVINRIEELDDVLDIWNAIIDYCSMTVNQSKNSDSSSATSTPIPAGN